MEELGWVVSSWLCLADSMFALLIQHLQVDFLFLVAAALLHPGDETEHSPAHQGRDPGQVERHVVVIETVSQ